MNLDIQKSKNMLNRLIIDWEKGKKTPWSKFRKKIHQKLDISISILNMQKYFKNSKIEGGDAFWNLQNESTMSAIQNHRRKDIH